MRAGDSMSGCLDSRSCSPLPKTIVNILGPSEKQSRSQASQICLLMVCDSPLSPNTGLHPTVKRKLQRKPKFRHSCCQQPWPIPTSNACHWTATGKKLVMFQGFLIQWPINVYKIGAYMLE